MLSFKYFHHCHFKFYNKHSKHLIIIIIITHAKLLDRKGFYAFSLSFTIYYYLSCRTGKLNQTTSSRILHTTTTCRRESLELDFCLPCMCDVRALRYSVHVLITVYKYAYAAPTPSNVIVAQTKRETTRFRVTHRNMY